MLHFPQSWEPLTLTQGNYEILVGLLCELENQQSWITKIKPKPWCKFPWYSLLDSYVMDRTTYFLKAGFKNLEGEELLLGDNGIACMSNLSLAEIHKHWLQEALNVMLFEIKSLAATKVPFSSSMTHCNTSTASWWEFKLNGVLWDSEILRVRAHKKFDESTGFLDLYFIFMFRVTDFRSVDKDDDSDGTLFQSDSKTLSAYRMTFA